MFCRTRPPPRSTLFPYTTLFRSDIHIEPFRSALVVRMRVDGLLRAVPAPADSPSTRMRTTRDRKSTRLNSSHVSTAYAVFCLKKKTSNRQQPHHSGTPYTSLPLS